MVCIHWNHVIKAILMAHGIHVDLDHKLNQFCYVEQLCSLMKIKQR